MPRAQSSDGLTKDEREKMRPFLSDRVWRMNNLYRITDAQGNDVLFRMRPAQEELFRAATDGKNPPTRHICLKARQLGFTTLIDIFALDLCLWNRNIRAGIIAHTREDAGIIFRDKIQYAYDHLPPFMHVWFPTVKNDAGELLLAHNSGIRVGTSFRSATAQFLHISEYGAICARYPKKANEIKTGALPAVHEGGYIFVESTAKGAEGEFYDLCTRAQQDDRPGKESSPLAFQFHFFPWHQNESYRIPASSVMIPDRLTEYFKGLETKGAIKLAPDQRAWYAETERNLGADMKQEHPSTPAEAFEQSIEGAYYRTQMDRAYADGRVCEGTVDPDYKVHTAWDIGEDTTAIWFFQGIGAQLRLVDYYENSGEGTEHYMDFLKTKDYEYGTFYGPHDLRVREWTAGKTRIEIIAQAYGITFQVAPSVSLDDGIEVVRRTLASCWFREGPCEQGLKALSNYRKDWDADKGTWKSTPRHDFASHGADSFRYLCLCWRPGADGGGAGKSEGKRGTNKKWGY